MNVSNDEGYHVDRFRLTILPIFLVLCIIFSCNGQQPVIPEASPRKVVGGPFENGDFIFNGLPDSISFTDTSPGWWQHGQHIRIAGTIYKRDGKTPAPGVILYYYHTDVNGIYPNRPGLDPRVKRHGYIRGWVKTDEDGRYQIFTVRPSPYPGGTEPAHIHPSILEPGIVNPYYIDEFVFDDDALLTSGKRRAMENRGGSGVLRFTGNDSIRVAEHDIILGLNIPGYPGSDTARSMSGLDAGLDQPSFQPFHAYGPDRGIRRSETLLSFIKTGASLNEWSMLRPLNLISGKSLWR